VGPRAVLDAVAKRKTPKGVLKELGYKRADQTELARNRYQWVAFLSTVMNFRSHKRRDIS
jgi:hypothetical protein